MRIDNSGPTRNSERCVASISFFIMMLNDVKLSKLLLRDASYKAVKGLSSIALVT